MELLQLGLLTREGLEDIDRQELIHAQMYLGSTGRASDTDVLGTSKHSRGFDSPRYAILSSSGDVSSQELLLSADSLSGTKLLIKTEILKITATLATFRCEVSRFAIYPGGAE